MYLDKTFCASTNCENHCGRKLSEDDIRFINKHGLLVSMAYFCGEPEKKENDSI